ncbi:hypothetical protein, partial [Desulfonatronospira sp.]|uniref:hypothetical protein n=1 Tax=Desulfonatronospira sp. TaxID=1962951 RepID=UPI0025C01D1D
MTGKKCPDKSTKRQAARYKVKLSGKYLFRDLENSDLPFLMSPDLNSGGIEYNITIRRLVQISNKHVGRYNRFLVPGSSFLVTSCSQAGAWEQERKEKKSLLACLWGQAPRHLFF